MSKSLEERDLEAAEYYYQMQRSKAHWNAETNMYERNVGFHDVFLAGLAHERARIAPVVAVLREALEKERVRQELDDGGVFNYITGALARAAELEGKQ